jgi:predicted acetyltransferase
MTMLRLRPLTEEEWPEYPAMMSKAFLFDPDPDPASVARVRALFEADRFLGIFEGDRLIGGGGILTRSMTLPGAGPSPVAAVSYVSVRPDARGRGALIALMRAQLSGLHDSGGEPLAALWSSQAAIYGRFGYATATRRAALTVAKPAPLRPGGPEGGRVRWSDETGAAEAMRQVHGRVARTRVGWLSRPEPSWQWWLSDTEAQRNGKTAYRYALHQPREGGAPDGYAVFRAKPDWPATGPDCEVSIHELIAATPQAHVGLWRALLDLDVVGRVRHRNVALDDPIPLLLLNPRAVLGEVSDALWVRLVDLDRALTARRYATECDVVLAVTDRFCSWNAGGWRFRVGADGTAEVSRTQAEPDLECDITDLAAAYLGGTRLTALAAAGRVRELRPGAVLAVSRSMGGDAEPYCPEVF